MAALSFGSASAAPPTDPKTAVSQLAPNRFEFVYSGTRFTSRDQIEGELLLSAARLALAHGEKWFVLLAMPGERTDVHPARANPAYGSKYGHWQPHWNYDLPPYGWQPWHPEWGGGFWTKDVDPKSVKRFEAHVMVDLGRSANPLDESVQFNAGDVVRDLSRSSIVAAPHVSH